MIKRLIPHICIVLGLVTLTLFILVQFNPGIADTTFYTLSVYAFSVSALVTAGMLIASNNRRD